MPTAIQDPDELNQLQSNTFMGTLPNMRNSTITFADGAQNNILFCEKGVSLVHCTIQINGSNSIVYLSSSRYHYLLTVSIHSNSVLYIGKNNGFTSNMHIIMSEQKHCFIGDDGLFSTDIWIRNADPHLIYSCETKQRLNPSQSVFVGDHVWLGQESRLLKGAQIDSGSIIGSMGVVAGKQVRHNTSWAGNPCKLIKTDIFWDRACVHAWLDEDTEHSLDWNTYITDQEDLTEDSFIFQHDPCTFIAFSDMDRLFTEAPIAEKLEFLQKLPADKNRFVRPDEPPARKSIWPWKHS